jgi:hypothetical protein
VVISDFLIDGFFFADILLNFRTSFLNSLTGDEVVDPKLIALNYLNSFRFWIDFISTAPFDIILGNFFQGDLASQFQVLSMLKLFRVLRLSRIITYMNSTDDVKHSLRLVKLGLFLVLYIHITACFVFFVAKIDAFRWQPP